MKFLKSTPASIFFVLGIALLPIYLWGSGGIQLAHLSLFIAALLMLFVKKLSVDAVDILLLLLCLYVTLRDGVLIALNADLSNGLPILYIIFSATIFIVGRRWLADGRSAHWAAIALLFSAGIAVIGVLVLGYGARVGYGDGLRSVGTFNNPNQLGYFAICLGSIGCVLYMRSVVKLRTLFLYQACAVFLAVASLSKAALLATAFPLLLMGFVASKSRLRFVFGILFSIAALFSVLWILESGKLDDSKLLLRLASFGVQGDDTFESRGYGVFSEMGGADFIFGFGAQKVNAIVGHEVHSTIGSYLANYGAIGFLLFVLFLALWGRKVLLEFGVLGVGVVVLPAMLYGVTHNGSRFTIFWVLLSISMTASSAVRGDSRQGIPRASDLYRFAKPD